MTSLLLSRQYLSRTLSIPLHHRVSHRPHSFDSFTRRHASNGQAASSSSSSQSSSSPSPKIRSRLARATIIAVSGSAFTAALLWWDDRYNYSTLTRNLRTAWNGAMFALDYKLNYDPNSLDSINALHERAAARLLRVCEKNRGLYVKLAQALGTQAAFLPPPYLALAKLLDNAEHFEYEAVERIIKEELGSPIEEVFVRFDREPIAAASIAQVHRARLRLPSGEEEEVAVKVQRPDIRRHAKWDLWAYRVLLRVYGYFFELPFDFAAQYISDQLMLETRFDNEAKNAIRIRNHVLNSSQPEIRDSVYVPRIHPDLSTERVLTMEFIENASKLTDMKKIAENGLNATKVAKSVAEVFSAQIFEYGFVQADGHPSNVLVRKHPSGRKGDHQVVLLDHGLYIALNPSFRRTYAELWYSIFIQDMDTIRRICQGWGIGAPELFASATLLRPWSPKKKKSQQEKRKEEEELLHEKSMSEDERKKKELAAMRAMKAQLKSFLENIELLPKELIFIGRAMRILQANNQTMGSPVNRINILAKHAAVGLLRFPVSDSPDSLKRPARTTLSTYVYSYTSFLRFRLTLLIVDIAFYGSNLVARITKLGVRLGLLSTGKGGPGGGFEDSLDKELREIARNKFGVNINEEAFA